MSVENFYDADVVISDTSSVIYEALALGIPVIITKWLVSEVYGSERDIYSRAPGNEVCWLANSQDEVLLYINRIKAGLGQGPKVKEFMEGVFPEELRGKSGKKSAETLLEYL
jgi:CDP-glycerol glycerophosphotransferase (TagB/SpsB family)